MLIVWVVTVGHNGTWVCECWSSCGQLPPATRWTTLF